MGLEKVNSAGHALSGMLRQAQTTVSGLLERNPRDRFADPRFESSHDEFEQEFTPSRPSRARLIVPLVILLVALVAGGAGFWMFYRGGSSSGAGTSQEEAAGESAPAATDAVAAQQQQTLEQVQSLQQDLAAQQAETKRLSDGFDALNRKIDALQQSFASTPLPSGRIAAPKRKPPLPPPGSTRLAPYIQ